MSDPHVKYLLIGGGRASSAAAGEIRRIDPEGAILLIGQEVNRPYERPALSGEYLLGRMTRERLFTQSDSWWADNHIELRTGRRAAGLSPSRHSVALDNGQTVSYDKLLIATGGSPKHLKCPGAELPNVFYLRNIEDADRLHHAIEKARSEGRAHERGRGSVAVIGGGILGVELAGTLSRLGLGVDLIAPADQLWSKFAGETAGRFAARYLESQGVRVHLRTSPLRLEGDGRVQRVVAPDRPDIGCDFVVAAIGITANKDLIRGTAIKAEHAILTDSHCRTSEADVFAAGDCAAVFDPLFGKHRLLDHWESAGVLGKIAGQNMAGLAKEYGGINAFSTRLPGLAVRVWGAPRSVVRRVVRGSVNAQEPDFMEIGIDAEDRIVQVLTVNHAGEDELIGELVGRRVMVKEREAMLRDPAAGLVGLV